LFYNFNLFFFIKKKRKGFFLLKKMEQYFPDYDDPYLTNYFRENENIGNFDLYEQDIEALSLYPELPESLHGFFSIENVSTATEDDTSFGNLPTILEDDASQLLNSLSDDFQSDKSDLVEDEPQVSEDTTATEEVPLSSKPRKRTSRGEKETDERVYLKKEVPVWHVTPRLKDYDVGKSQRAVPSGFLEAIAYVFEAPSFDFPDFTSFERKRSDLRSFMVSPNHRNKLDAEQHLQFPEFEDRTFDLLGNSDSEKILRFLPSPRRGIRISHEDLRRMPSDVFEKIQFIDARFDYEYQEGTIGDPFLDTSINVDEYWDLNKILNTFWKLDNGYTPRFQGKTLVIFCEFSSLRGPGLYRNITIIDHVLLYSRISAGKKEIPISYPEIYILDGGFCDAYKSEQDLPPFGINRESLVYNPRHEGLAKYVSEFHKNSDDIWKAKQNYMENTMNYSSFFEENGLYSIFHIWNPFKADERGEDYFLILKRNIYRALKNQPISSPSSLGSSKMQRLNSIIQ